jgi:hypothetical protein
LVEEVVSHAGHAEPGSHAAGDRSGVS